MANSSAKKLHKANTQRLNTLRALILIANIAYALRWFLLPTTISSFHKIVFVALTVVHVLTFSLIWLSAKPTFSDTGTLIDAGHDISNPGMLEYIHDIIYLTVFIQLLLLVTRWALLFYLVVPVFAIYLSCFSAGTTVPDPEEHQPADHLATMSRKERRKAERTARKHH